MQPCFVQQSAESAASASPVLSEIRIRNAFQLEIVQISVESMKNIADALIRAQQLVIDQLAKFASVNVNQAVSVNRDTFEIPTIHA